MELYVGTSGYSYPEWKGSFYPTGLPAASMLRFYGERFRTVESNNTFYRMPTAESLSKPSAAVPGDFKFVLKAPQTITHIKRLKGAGDLVAQFLDAADALNERRGPVLFQLPPNLRKDAPRLADFLSALPKSCRAAFEFRHASWFDEEVCELLRFRQAALCVADADDDLDVPLWATADWGYVRLRRSDYRDAELKLWLNRLQDQGWREAFVFFKHEDAGKGPQFAQRFLELAGKAS